MLLRRSQVAVSDKTFRIGEGMARSGKKPEVISAFQKKHGVGLCDRSYRWYRPSACCSQCKTSRQMHAIRVGQKIFNGHRSAQAGHEIWDQQACRAKFIQSYLPMANLCRATELAATGIASRDTRHSHVQGCIFPPAARLLGDAGRSRVRSMLLCPLRPRTDLFFQNSPLLRNQSE